MNYRVHLFVSVRIPVGVEAQNHDQAMDRALNELADIRDYLRNGAEYAEEVIAFLVDEEGDEEFLNTKLYDAEGNLGAPSATTLRHLLAEGADLAEGKPEFTEWLAKVQKECG